MGSTHGRKRQKNDLAFPSRPEASKKRFGVSAPAGSIKKNILAFPSWPEASKKKIWRFRPGRKHQKKYFGVSVLAGSIKKNDLSFPSRPEASRKIFGVSVLAGSIKKEWVASRPRTEDPLLSCVHRNTRPARAKCNRAV
jgi:hypothetical protein